MKPFLYIAGLFRSGTTLVQELLTEKDVSFIFHEPRFGDGWWQFQEHDRNYLRTHWNLELPAYLPNVGETWDWFQKQDIQIGAKEIRNAKGRFYYDTWMGNMRFIVVDRDPADVFISAHKMMLRSNTDFTWSPRYLPFNAVNIYRELIEEVRNINAIWEWCHPKCRMVVHYKDVCEGKTEDLYDFAESDVQNPEVGYYHSILTRGKYENGLHGNEITKASFDYGKYYDKRISTEAVKLRNLLDREKAWL